jgi:hypothetical protein
LVAGFTVASLSAPAASLLYHDRVFVLLTLVLLLKQRVARREIVVMVCASIASVGRIPARWCGRIARSRRALSGLVTGIGVCHFV